MRFLSVFVILLFVTSISSLYGRDWEKYLSEKALVNVSRKDTTLRVHLMYAYPDNFLGEAVYNGLKEAWLRPEAAEMLMKAQRLLKMEYPGRTLIVYDAVRPMSVQYIMWGKVRGTDKTNYVANPANGGGLHNYGMAVDVSILDEGGIPLQMGTAVDFFGEEAHTNNEDALLEMGKITPEEFQNRRYLRRIMRQAGFRAIPYEWWHFNACSRAEARELYPVIE